jgi:hypothetical protein
VLPFPRSALDYYMLDDVAGHLHRPDVERTYAWDEHPTGRIVARTNNLGFREDEPTRPAKEAGALRILVTGDSHIDGVVYNAESFPNVLEKSLRATMPGRTVEVINGGVGHFGPQNYLGFLTKYLDLAPDLYVVVLYTGNDFLDAVRTAVTRGQLRIPERPPEYMPRLTRAQARVPAAVDQSLNQIYFFKAFPELEERACAIVAEQLEQVRALCAEHGIDLLVIALPGKIDVEYATDADRLDEVMSLLGLDAQDRTINQRITQALAALMSPKGVLILDPLPELRAASGPLYWREDHHLNVAGHAALAQAVLPRVAARK